jgi:prepilin-type N-terminal cleavage/methylation domain-containing protein
MKRLKSDKQGFSLLEMAIAIVVLGLVASFTIKGKELVHTARLRSVVEQVATFKIAVQIFIDKYGGLPGTIANASRDIGDVENGDGSWKITSTETSKRFWSHLLATDLLTSELQNGYPVSKLGGIYSVSSSVPGHPGIWIILSNGTADNVKFQGIISQEDAGYMDKNNDTGNPTLGEIITMKADGDTLTDIGQLYDTKNKNKNCVIMFKISN